MFHEKNKKRALSSSTIANKIIVSVKGRGRNCVMALTSTDLFLASASALAMACFTPCSAILTQSYGKSIGQFWHIFA
jgi:hypothetical protein